MVIQQPTGWLLRVRVNENIEKTLFGFLFHVFFTLLAFVFGFGDTEIGGLHWVFVSSL